MEKLTMSLLDKHPDILKNTDKPSITESNESDIAAFASSWLLERGYPVIHTDSYSLQADFLKRNYLIEVDNQ